MSLSPDLTPEELETVDAWWRANNYLTVGQIYLMANPLLREPLTSEHIKPRLLGHWGTTPGLTFLYSHLSRLIRHTDQDVVFITGPGHGGPGLTAASWLEGTWSKVYPAMSQDVEGMLKFFRGFSAPGGFPSHVAVTTPGSIHEGGELGYALVHAFGSVFDNPDLLTVAVVGDGEAETGPLEGSWKGISFLNPVRDGAVLPILHLNGAKIAGPTVLARKDPAEVKKLFEGHGYDVLEFEVKDANDTATAHREFAAVLAEAYTKIKAIQTSARHGEWDGKRPHWPMIVFRHPKGWTGPKTVDGQVVEGTWRAHQVPLSGVKDDPAHLKMLQDWLHSYRHEELFDVDGKPTEVVTRNNPAGEKAMSATPYANGGKDARDLDLPDFRDFAVEVAKPAQERLESTRKMGEFLRAVYEKNPTNFRLFCPDETNSNRLGAVFDVSDRAFMESVNDIDVKISKDGRVMEVLSEHNCHGWLEGYTLTGRHGFFPTYESFAMVSASQTIQHSKWLQEGDELEWRKPVPSLNILLTSTCWRNDHNGFSHQGPGLIQNVLNMRGSVARVYLPPDANCLLSVTDHVLRSKNYTNVVVIDKQPQPQWLSMEEAIKHCKAGASIWHWAGNEPAGNVEPDIVLACAGDIPTMEVVAAAEILKQQLPALKTRVVNVVDLMTLIRPKDHPHGMDELRFKELFTEVKDVIFAFHGYPGAIHQLVHGRPDADRFRVRGFIEEGTTTTPFDMVVKNRISRFHLVMDAINNAKITPPGASELKAWCEEMLAKHATYIVEHLQDMPEVRDWKFGYEQQVPEAPAADEHVPGARTTV